MKTIRKVISFLLCFLLCFEQSGFAQVAGQLDISGYIGGLRNSFAQDKFRPLHLRYLSYDSQNNNFQLLLDKGDYFKIPNSKLQIPNKSQKSKLQTEELKEETKKLMEYFFIGLSLPNESFWVNLRPDTSDNILDKEIEKTDIGRILLEADVQLKKDTARWTSPEAKEGKEYWDKLYKKAEELFGYENITIPTLTRPWIVPNEIIIRETSTNAYIYKATLKVMLEEDYLKGNIVGAGLVPARYEFKDTRLKELNTYSTQLIKELIIPKLTKEVNTAKRYAPLRQVYYSLILAQWFKQRFRAESIVHSPQFIDKNNVGDGPARPDNNRINNMIDSGNLSGLTSKQAWDKQTYYQEYRKSFKDGEYNIKQPMRTPFGQSIRSYFSGGVALQGIPEIASAGNVQGSAKIDFPKLVIGPNSPLLSAGADGNPGAINLTMEPLSEEIQEGERQIKEEEHLPSVGGALSSEKDNSKTGFATASLSEIRKAKIDEMISAVEDVIRNPTVSPKLKEKAEGFKRVYLQLEKAAMMIALGYQKIALRYGFDPGEIALYQVGGRVKGKELSEESDIDLLFTVEFPMRSPESLQYIMDKLGIREDPMGFRNFVMTECIEMVKNVCKVLQIPNEFHVLSFGASLPQGAPVVINNTALLLAISSDISLLLTNLQILFERQGITGVSEIQLGLLAELISNAQSAAKEQGEGREVELDEAEVRKVFDKSDLSPGIINRIVGLGLGDVGMGGMPMYGFGSIRVKTAEEEESEAVKKQVEKRKARLKRMAENQQQPLSWGYHGTSLYALQGAKQASEKGVGGYRFLPRDAARQKGIAVLSGGGSNWGDEIGKSNIAITNSYKVARASAEYNANFDKNMLNPEYLREKISLTKQRLEGFRQEGKTGIPIYKILEQDYEELQSRLADLERVLSSG
ncbi:MAG: hypothetical protein V2A64_00390, partial [Candidatus Omnitrophota bacterium]